MPVFTPQRSTTKLSVAPKSRLHGAFAAARAGVVPTWVGLASVESLSLPLALGFVCLSIAWLFPGHFLPWPGFRQELIAALAFSLLALAAIRAPERIFWPRIAILTFAAAALPLLQFGVGQIDFLGSAVLSAAYVAAFSTSIIVGATLSSGSLRGQVLEGFAACAVLAGIVSSGMALCQWLGPGVWEGLLDPHGGPRPFANIGQPNHLSTQLLLGVVGALFWYEKRRIQGGCAAAIVVWLGLGVVLTESRTGWVSAVAIAAWWLLKRKRASLRLRAAPLIAALALLMLAVYGLGQLNALNTVLDPTVDPSTGLRLRSGTRPLHWAMLADALRQSPWLGYGWGQVANAQYAVSANHPATGEWLTQSHNLALDLLVYNGLPIGLLLCAVLVTWFVRHGRACADPPTWCLLAALFVLFSHALLENPLHYAYFLLPAGLLIGMASQALRAQEAWTRPKWSLALPCSLLLVPLTVVSAEYLQAEETLRDLELAIRGVGMPASDLPKHNWYLVDGWAAYHRASTMEVTAGMAPAQIDELRKVISRYPYPNVLMQYARASALNANPAAARFAFVHGCKVFGPPTCEQMRKVWTNLQSSQPQLRAVEFPAWPG